MASTILHKTQRVFRRPPAITSKPLRRIATGFPIAVYSGSGADGLRITVSGTPVASLDWIGAIPGVQIVAVAGRNGPGFGRLRSERDGSWIAWRAPGSTTYGPPVQATTSGEFVIHDGEDRDKWIRVEVFVDYFPGFASTREIELVDRFENPVSGPDVAAADASAGLTTTETYTLENVSPWTFHQVRAWVDPQTVTMNTSDDGAAWVTPTTEAAALLLADRLDPGRTVVLFSQRVIPAGSYFSAGTLLGLQVAFGRV